MDAADLPDADEGRIRDRAYFLWLAAGMPHGRDAEHWEEARREAGQPPPTPTGLRIMAHVQTLGDVESGEDGWAGVPGSGLAVEGFILHWDGPPLLEYEAIWSAADHSTRAASGAFCGTRGQAKALRGFLLAAGPGLGISGEARFVDGTRVDAVGGTPCVAASGAALEAFRLAATT